MHGLTWNQIFAIVEHFDTTDEEVCERFKLSIKEFEIARSLQKEEGLFQPDADIDFSLYNNIFPQKGLFDAEEAKTPTSETENGDTPLKRGRKTRKIKDAYEALTSEKIPIDDFIKTHGVSLSVLRRHKNFDHIPETGQVNVRKISLVKNGERILCIWREPKK